MTSGTANFQESSAIMGDTIHADFTWADAVYYQPGNCYAAMYIIDPDGIATYYNEPNLGTGNKTLTYVTDKVGTWTAAIDINDGADWVTATDMITVSSPGVTSGSANFQETSAVVGDTIHADFTWNNAVYYQPCNCYAAMYIIDPDGIATYYNEPNLGTGNKTLTYVTDKVGTWTAAIDINDGADWVTATDDLYVSEPGGGNASITNFTITPNPVPLGDNVTVYVRGVNTGGSSEYFCIGIWSEQHETDWSDWFWVGPGNAFSWSRILSNVQYEQNCQVYIWWWNGSESIEVDFAWDMIYIAGPVETIANILFDQSIFYTGPFSPSTNVEVADVWYKNTGSLTGNIYWRLYEYPDNIGGVEHLSIDEMIPNCSPNSSNHVPIYLTTPTLSLLSIPSLEDINWASLANGAILTSSDSRPQSNWDNMHDENNDTFGYLDWYPGHWVKISFSPRMINRIKFYADQVGEHYIKYLRASDDTWVDISGYMPESSTPQWYIYDLLDEVKAIMYDQVGQTPAGGGSCKIYEFQAFGTGNGDVSLPLGVKFWGASESEPAWGAMGTAIANLNIKKY